MGMILLSTDLMLSQTHLENSECVLRFNRLQKILLKQESALQEGGV